MDTNAYNGLMATVKTALPGAAEKAPSQMAALTLAYIGDTVYDLFVRTLMLETRDAKVHELHLLSAKAVCAAGQAASFREIEPMLSEEELSVFRRGRNSHMGTVPKNAAITDYRTATGLEALMGFLYLSGRDERLTALMTVMLKKYMPEVK